MIGSAFVVNTFTFVTRVNHMKNRKGEYNMATMTCLSAIGLYLLIPYVVIFQAALEVIGIKFCWVTQK